MEKKLRIIKLGLLIGVGFVLLGAGCDFLFRLLLEKNISRATGLPTTIESLHISLSAPHIHIKEILIDNPEGFTEHRLARISEAYLEWDLPDLLKGKYHLKEAWLMVEELFVSEKKEGGPTNIELLLSRSQNSDLPVRIDRLNLTVERVLFRDRGNLLRPYSLDPLVRHERFENLVNFGDLVQKILLRATPQEAK